MVLDTRNMAVKAMLGSADFWRTDINGQVNGTTMKRSPGSTLKPFIYALALDQVLIHPATILKDVSTSFGDYDPENFDKDFLGPISAKNALILSRNIPAIDLANKLHDPTLYKFLQLAEVTGLNCTDTVLSWFIPGKSPITQDNIYREIAIDKKTGLRACHPWFVDKTYVGYSSGSVPFWWSAKPGKFVVRAIDDYGRAAAGEYRGYRKNLMDCHPNGFIRDKNIRCLTTFAGAHCVEHAVLQYPTTYSIIATA